MYANYDVIKDLDEEEKELMKNTFENTVKNAEKIMIEKKSNIVEYTKKRKIV